MLQWVCWDTWNRGWHLQVVWSVVQHTETKVSCVSSCDLNVLHTPPKFIQVCVLCWCTLKWIYMCTTRGEFESDGSPDLNKDVYLQDIHCVSSLCKAYFRELPNPLLTYQLYDKFAVSSSETQTFHTISLCVHGVYWTDCRGIKYHLQTKSMEYKNQNKSRSANKKSQVCLSICTGRITNTIVWKFSQAPNVTCVNKILSANWTYQVSKTKVLNAEWLLSKFYIIIEYSITLFFITNKYM